MVGPKQFHGAPCESASNGVHFAPFRFPSVEPHLLSITLASIRVGPALPGGSFVILLKYLMSREGLKVVVMAKSLLTQQDRRLLLETRGILEELLETEEVLRDRALMKSIKESRKDVKAGRVYTIGELKRKLREEGKL